MTARQLAAAAMAIHVIHRNLDLDELRAEFDELALITSRLADLVVELEARVEQLENHPVGCSCTRCTG